MPKKRFLKKMVLSMKQLTILLKIRYPVCNAILEIGH